jgi:hypothetical protein
MRMKNRLRLAVGSATAITRLSPAMIRRSFAPPGFAITG